MWWVKLSGLLNGTIEICVMGDARDGTSGANDGWPSPLFVVCPPGVVVEDGDCGCCPLEAGWCCGMTY